MAVNQLAGRRPLKNTSNETFGALVVSYDKKLDLLKDEYFRILYIIAGYQKKMDSKN